MFPQQSKVEIALRWFLPKVPNSPLSSVNFLLKSSSSAKSLSPRERDYRDGVVSTKMQWLRKPNDSLDLSSRYWSCTNRATGVHICCFWCHLSTAKYIYGCRDSWWMDFGGNPFLSQQQDSNGNVGADRHGKEKCRRMSAAK